MTDRPVTRSEFEALRLEVADLRAVVRGDAVIRRDTGAVEYLDSLCLRNPRGATIIGSNGYPKDVDA